MFEQNSRYYKIETVTLTDPSGRAGRLQAAPIPAPR